MSSRAAKYKGKADNFENLQHFICRPINYEEENGVFRNSLFFWGCVAVIAIAAVIFK